MMLRCCVFSGSVHRGGDRDRYDMDRRPARRRDSLDYRERDSAYASRQSVAHGSYRSGDPVGGYTRSNSGGAGYRPVPSSYDPPGYRGVRDHSYPSRYGDEAPPRGYAPMAGDPGDRYRGGERYPRHAVGAGPYSGSGTGPSPVLSRYDNRYDIMGGDGMRDIDSVSSRGRDRYPQDNARYGADATRPYRDVPPVASMGYDRYGSADVSRRSRSRSRDKYPAMGAPDYRRPAVAASTYSGDGAYERYIYGLPDYSVKKILIGLFLLNALGMTPLVRLHLTMGTDRTLVAEDALMIIPPQHLTDQAMPCKEYAYDSFLINHLSVLPFFRRGYEQRTQHYEDSLHATHMSSYEEYQRQRRH